LILQRRSRVVGTVLAPDWLPSRNIQVRLEWAGDPQQRRDDRIHDTQGKKYIYFDWVRPGIYNVLLRVQDFPDPFARILGLEIQPGQQGLHPRLHDLDLGLYLHRFEVAAIDEQGRSIEPSGPLVARIVRPGGQTGFVGFPWRQGKTEILSTSTQLDVWPMAAGYRAEPTVLGAGRSELRFLKIPPFELHLPGFRQLVGTTTVWVNMTLVSGVGLPDTLETWDQRSNRIAQWYGRGRSAGARLGDGAAPIASYGNADPRDLVRMPLMHDGRYQVTAYLGDKSKRVRPVPIELGTADVRWVPGAGTQRTTLVVDPALAQRGLAELAQREAASAGGR
jgi:hypothetical protein